MSPQRIEEIVACAGAVAAGTVLLMDEAHMPDVFKQLAARLGNARKPVGIGIIVVGVVLGVFGS